MVFAFIIFAHLRVIIFLTMIGFHTVYYLHENEGKFRLTNVMELHFIKMTKLLKDWKKSKLDPWDDVLARWLLLLGMVDHRKIHDEIFKELKEIAMKDETLKDAFKSWEEMSLTREQRLAYDSRLKKILDEESAVREAELRLQEEVEKAKKEGMEEGIKKEKESIVRRLLDKGMDIDTIAEITGLEKDRIKNIR